MNNFDTTYYLCALSHLDEGFREKIINDFIDEEYKSLSPSYGIDIVPIIKHCIASNRIHLFRNILLSLVFLFILLSIKSGDFSLIFILLTLSWIIVFIKLLSSHLLINGLALIPNKTLAVLNKRHNFSYIKEKLKQAKNAQDSNIIIYDRFLPFIGFGSKLDSWSFTLDTSKGKNEANNVISPSSFELIELYSLLTARIDELDIKTLTIKDRLFVDGQKIDCMENLNLLVNQFNRPICNIDDDIVKSYINNINNYIRYYKCFHISLFDGDIVSSIFLRFTQIKQNLYIEFNIYLLPPLDEEYYKIVDSAKEISRYKKVFEIALKTTIRFLFLLVFSPFIILAKIFSLLPKDKNKKTKELIRKKLFNYGATTSMREYFSSLKYLKYSQILDQDMYSKVIQRRTLDTITEFLDSKGIDTSDLKDRKNTIYNNGIIVSGGSIETNNLTVGQQAKSTIVNRE